MTIRTAQPFFALALSLLVLPVNAARAGIAPGPAAELQRRLADQERKVAEQQKQLDEQKKELDELRKLISQLKPPAPAKPGAPTPTHKDLFRNGFNMKIYGYLRGDFEADTQRMNFDPQLPFFVLSPQMAPAAGAAAVTTGGLKQGDSTFHTRLTRVGFDVTAPASSFLGGWKPTAKLETDFFNAFTTGAPTRDLVSNSRSALRIRHAYVRAQRGDWHVLAGQTWDVISPIFPSLNFDTVMWNAGNTADRRPQLRVGYEPKAGRGKWSLVGAVGSTGAVDNADLDANGLRDGEQAGMPTFQARAGYSRPSWVKSQDWTLGVYGHAARHRFAGARVAGRDDYDSNLVGLDAVMPLTNKLKLQGEAWHGSALSDVRGGIGQSLNAATGQTISASGGWAELSWKAAPFYTINFGGTIDTPRASHVPVFGRTQNSTLYLTNRFTLGSGLEAGIDLAHWQTRYNALAKGVNNRLTMYLQHNF